ALCRRHRCLAIDHVLFDYHPAGVPVRGKKSKQTRKIDAAFSDRGENAGADGLLEVEIAPPRFPQNSGVDVLDVNVPEKRAIFLRFLRGIAAAVNAMACIKAQA